MQVVNDIMFQVNGLIGAIFESNLSKFKMMRYPPFSVRNDWVALGMTRIAEAFLNIGYVETPAGLVVGKPQTQQSKLEKKPISTKFKR